ncbi:MAG: YqgE/AlgH family protein [Chitinophagales bacterium]|nr:YqgE/AlgH family protein [Chitinophagales bacterium]MCZ2393211.1 YqgE/AlgH family protein [Chitinophagales bacterium]
MSTIKVQAGDLLVSEPFMDDPNFKRTVILITENDETGTLGLVLNKPSIFHLREVLNDFPKFNSKVYLGGPVGLDRINFIHSYPDLIPKSIQITNQLYWNGDYDSLKKNIETQQILPHNIKFFIGYSGWGIGQLEEEIKEGSWIVSKGYTNILKSSEYLWKDVLEKMGGKYKLIANYPEDPTFN